MPIETRVIGHIKYNSIIYLIMIKNKLYRMETWWASAGWPFGGRPRRERYLGPLDGLLIGSRHQLTTMEGSISSRS